MKDVHTEHCCSRHGCKYGYWDGKTERDPKWSYRSDEICTVTSGKAPQSFPCEDCEYDDISTARTLKEVLNDDRFGFIAETKATLAGVIDQLMAPYPWVNDENIWRY